MNSRFDDFLRQRYSLDVSGGDAMSLSMQALGLIGFANTSGNAADMLEARQMYGRALTLTNQALSNSALATSDAVLAAVFFLTMIEVRYYQCLARSSHILTFAAHESHIVGGVPPVACAHRRCNDAD